jgi:hypothetical protein
MLTATTTSDMTVALDRCGEKRTLVHTKCKKLIARHLKNIETNAMPIRANRRQSAPTNANERLARSSIRRTLGGELLARLASPPDDSPSCASHHGARALASPRRAPSCSFAAVLLLQRQLRADLNTLCGCIPERDGDGCKARDRRRATPQPVPSGRQSRRVWRSALTQRHESAPCMKAPVPPVSAPAGQCSEKK